MKKILCLLKNGLNPFPYLGLMHNYREVKNGWNRKTKRYEQVLRCENCGQEDMSWSKQPIF